MASETKENTGWMAFAPSMAVSSEDDSDVTSWLLCRAGSHCFALPTQDVIEIMRMLPIESVADAPPLVRGLSIIRGKPVPVVDTALLFSGQSARCERIVTIRTGNRTIAFAAEAVLGIEAIRSRALEKSPPLLRDVEAIAAITALDEELVVFLQTARVVPDEFFDGRNADGAQA